MCVFKPVYKLADGTTTTTPRYYVEFYDHHRRRHRVPAYTDEGATRDLNRKIVELVIARVDRRPMDVGSQRWVHTLPPRLRQRLADIDLIDADLVASLRPLPELVGQWAEHLHATGATESHVKQVTVRALRVMTGAGAVSLGDLDASRVEQFLRQEREQGTSIRTSNFHLQATRQFVKWAVRTGLLPDDPLRSIQPLNPAVDRRRERRALTFDEARALLAATQEGPTRDGRTGEPCANGMSGPERALLYLFAMETGLRRNEVKTLRVADLDLADVEHALVRVRSVHAKNRRDAFLPLRVETARTLADWLSGRQADAPVFGCPTHWRSADVLRMDLAAAGIAYSDGSSRVVDFHALRTTFGTALARSGVALQIAQRLMRHSSPDLTSNIYTVLGREDERAAVEALPDLSPLRARIRDRGGRARGAEDATRRPRASDLPLLLNAAETAAMLGMRRSRFRRCDATGQVPRALHVGGARRWSRPELHRWVRAGCPSRPEWERTQHRQPASTGAEASARH